MFPEDAERMEGGDGGHRPGEDGAAAVRRGSVTDSGLVHARTGERTGKEDAPTSARGSS